MSPVSPLGNVEPCPVKARVSLMQKQTFKLFLKELPNHKVGKELSVTSIQPLYLCFHAGNVFIEKLKHPNERILII